MSKYNGWHIYQQQAGYCGYGIGLILGPKSGAGSYFWMGLGRNVITFNWGSKDY